MAQSSQEDDKKNVIEVESIKNSPDAEQIELICRKIRGGC